MTRDMWNEVMETYITWNVLVDAQGLVVYASSIRFFS